MTSTCNFQWVKSDSAWIELDSRNLRCCLMNFGKCLRDD